MNMHKRIYTKIIPILGKTTLSIIGFFILMAAYFQALFAWYGLGVPNLGRLLHGVSTLLTTPLTSAYLDFRVLGSIFTLPSETLSEFYNNGILHKIFSNFGLDLVKQLILFTLVLLSVYLYERSTHKTPKTTIVFYMLIPSMIWFLIPLILSHVSNLL